MPGEGARSCDGSAEAAVLDADAASCGSGEEYSAEGAAQTARLSGQDGTQTALSGNVRLHSEKHPAAVLAAAAPLRSSEGLSGTLAALLQSQPRGTCAFVGEAALPSRLFLTEPSSSPLRSLSLANAAAAVRLAALGHVRAPQPPPPSQPRETVEIEDSSEESPSSQHEFPQSRPRLLLEENGALPRSPSQVRSAGDADASSDCRSAEGEESFQQKPLAPKKTNQGRAAVAPCSSEEGDGADAPGEEVSPPEPAAAARGCSAPALRQKSLRLQKRLADRQKILQEAQKRQHSSRGAGRSAREKAACQQGRRTASASQKSTPEDEGPDRDSGEELSAGEASGAEPFQTEEREEPFRQVLSPSKRRKALAAKGAGVLLGCLALGFSSPPLCKPPALGLFRLCAPAGSGRAFGWKLGLNLSLKARRKKAAALGEKT